MFSRLKHHIREIQFPIKEFLIGLFVRLLIMPFMMHSDFFYMYWLASCAVFEERRVYKMQTVLIYLHGAVEWFTSSIVPVSKTLCSSYELAVTLRSEDWFHFISQPDIYRLLFVYKLPYLIMDIGCAYLVFRLVQTKNPQRLFRFWWWNPLLIFAIYMFGRHETFALFFILLSIYLLKKSKMTWGLLSLGLAITLRYYALFLLPIYVLVLRAGWKDRFRLGVLGLLPWFVINILTWVFGGSPDISGLARYPNELYLLPMKFQVAEWDNIYIFPLGYLLILLYLNHCKELGVPAIQKYSLISLLWMFATSYVGQSPHYWTWFLPFLVLEIPEEPRLEGLHWLQIASLSVYGFIGSRAFSWYLLGPISPEFFWSLPSPIELISLIMPAETVISLAHTAFSAVTLWMAYLVCKKTIRVEAQTKEVN